MADYRNNNETFDQRYLTTAELDKTVISPKKWVWGDNANGQVGDGTLADKSSPTQTLMGGTGWTYVAAGDSFASAIRSDYTIWSQGVNASGQLGSDNLISVSSPVQTTAGGWDWADVKSGDTASIALKKDGSLWSWGQNYDGALGFRFWPKAGFPAAYRPQRVPIGGQWSSITNGGFVAGGIKTDGTLWMWGSDNSGSLGLGSQTTTNSPTQILGGGTNWKQVQTSVVYNITGAVKHDGSLWTWGYNLYGQLGDGTTANKSSPVQTITASNDWSQVAPGGYFMAAIKNDGSLWTWGRNDYGQLGDNTTTNKSSPVQTVAGGNDWASVACGQEHVAAIKTDGSLWTWGNNTSGQLTVGTTIRKSSPVQTIASGNDWQTVSCGRYHTFGIKTDGTLWSCGYGGQGDLGDGTAEYRSSFVQVYGGGNDWVSVSCTYFTQAVKSDGSIWGWGSNFGNAAGLGTVPLSYSPVINQTGQGFNWKGLVGGGKHLVAIAGDNSVWLTGDNSRGQLGTWDTLGKSSLVQWGQYSDWAKVSLGRYIGGGIKTDGSLWLWGRNFASDLGTEHGLARSSPVQTIAGGNDWESLSVTQGTVGAIKTDGTLWMWGADNYGQLGQGVILPRSSPVQTIAGGTDWAQVSVHYSHSAALKDDGTIWLWGRNNNGQLGDGTTVNKSSPVQTIAGGTDWYYIDIGESHSAGIKTDGTLWLWGRNNWGALGDGTIVNKSSPVQTIAGGTNWQQVYCGGNSTVAIKTDGTLWTWGDNWTGQLGDGTTVNKSSPIQTTAGGSDWVSAAFKAAHVIARKTNGSIWAWGKEAYGELGVPEHATYPDYVSFRNPTELTAFGTGWKDVTCGYEASGAIKYDGSFWTWGRNTYAVLGDNYIDIPQNPAPRPVYASDPFIAASVDCGYEFTAAIRTSDNRLFSFGANDAGQLGDGTTVDKSSPVQTIAGGNIWKQLGTGYSHAAAVKTDGTLWTWGNNADGQLGDGTTVDKSSPVQTIAGGNTWSKVACGDYHTLAIKTDGTLWLWGKNTSGQLGDGTTVDKSSPVQTVGYGTDWLYVSAGESHSAGIKGDGGLWLWGRDTSGELGDLSTVTKLSPVQTSMDKTTWLQVDCGGNHTTAIQNGENSSYVYFNFK